MMDKSLITVELNKLWMHKLLQEMDTYTRNLPRSLVNVVDSGFKRMFLMYLTKIWYTLLLEHIYVFFFYP